MELFFFLLFLYSENIDVVTFRKNKKSITITIRKK